jgi:hypothetical protein
MKFIITFAAAATFSVSFSVAANAQAKGIDTQNQQIREVGGSQGMTDNGSRRTPGTGRGFDFGDDKTADRVILANPYRLPSKRDLLVNSIADVMREMNLIVDESASRLSDGIVIAQPFTFAKGAVIAQSQLSRYAVLPQTRTDDTWSRGRYTLRVEAQSIDGINNNVSVTAKVEGQASDGLRSNWQTLESSGEAEQQFLNALVERITGTAPNAPKAANP